MEKIRADKIGEAIEHLRDKVAEGYEGMSMTELSLAIIAMRLDDIGQVVDMKIGNDDTYLRW